MLSQAHLQDLQVDTRPKPAKEIAYLNAPQKDKSNLWFGGSV